MKTTEFTNVVPRATAASVSIDELDETPQPAQAMRRNAVVRRTLLLACALLAAWLTFTARQSVTAYEAELQVMDENATIFTTNLLSVLKDRPHRPAAGLR